MTTRLAFSQDHRRMSKDTREFVYVVKVVSESSTAAVNC